MINNLTELLSKLGYETPAALGKAFYKYVSCGPWISFTVQDVPATTTGAIDIPAIENSISPSHTFDHNKCVGIKFGSIIEGSEAEVGPYELRFPFEADQVYKILCMIDEEADYLWDRDNNPNNSDMAGKL